MSTSVQHASPHKRKAVVASDMSVHPSPRRALGDVTNSARNTPVKTNTVANETGKATPAGSPLKRQRALTPATILSMKGSYGQSPIGSSKKRPFEAIDDQENAGDADRRSPYRIMTMGPSPHLARVARPPIITIMPLPDADSSTDEENSPVLPYEASEEGSDAESVIAKPVSGSFSSLIDYDPTNASDKSERASASPESFMRAEPMPSRAELLKLRLKMAMYKVNTDQAHVPFSNLRIPNTPAAQPTHSSEDEEDLVLQIGPPPGAASVQATPNITITGGPVSKLLPPPILLPTAFSSRFISAPVKSSPPRPVAVTPLPPRKATIIIDNTETPEDSPEKGYERRIVDGEKELTSSVVKGRAASGLLELMMAR